MCAPFIGYEEQGFPRFGNLASFRRVYDIVGYYPVQNFTPVENNVFHKELQWAQKQQQLF